MLDLRQIVSTRAVKLIGFDPDRRPLVHRTPVHFGAARQGAETGLGASRRQEGADHVAEARERRSDTGIDDGRDPLAIGGLRDRRSCHKDRACGEIPEQAIKLVDDPLRHDPGVEEPEPTRLVDLICPSI